MKVLRQIRKRLRSVFFPKRVGQPSLATPVSLPTNTTHSHSYTQYTQPTPAVVALTRAVGDLQNRQIRLRRRLKEFIASIDPSPSVQDSDSDEWYRDTDPDEKDEENRHKDTLLSLRREAFRLTERLDELQAWLASLRTAGDRFVITRRQARTLQDMLATIWEGARQLEQLESDAWYRVHRAAAA